MEEYIQKMLKSFEFYSLACGITDHEATLIKIKNVSKIKVDTPEQISSVRRNKLTTFRRSKWLGFAGAN